MIESKFNSKKISYPQNWLDLNFFQALRLQSAESNAEIVSILTGLPLEEVGQSKDVAGFEIIMASFNWYAVAPEFPRPEIVNVKGFELVIPDDIGHHSVDQFECLRVVIADLYKDGEPSYLACLSAYPSICSIYLQPLIDGHFDITKAKTLEQHIYIMKAYEVLGLGTFFFKNLIDSISGIERAMRKQKPTPIRKLLAYLRS